MRVHRNAAQEWNAYDTNAEIVISVHTTMSFNGKLPQAKQMESARPAQMNAHTKKHADTNTKFEVAQNERKTF